MFIKALLCKLFELKEHEMMLVIDITEQKTRFLVLYAIITNVLLN